MVLHALCGGALVPLPVVLITACGGICIVVLWARRAGEMREHGEHLSSKVLLGSREELVPLGG